MALRELPPPFSVSPAAQTYLNAQLSGQTQGTGVRIGLKNAGCSGFRYQFSFASAAQPGERAATIDKIPFIIDTMAEMHLLGATLDLITQGMNQTLDFVGNPNETGRCGCGESVTFNSNS